MSHDALIGHTGFVGGTLLRDHPFAATFNSRNIEAIRGQSFGRVVCAGVSAVKWLANKEPEQDWQAICRLIDCLKEVSARSFVLISTIDVYREPNGATENEVLSLEGLHPYGLHRLRLEAFVAGHFAWHTIVRLPALFGPGLKKNALYDLIHRNQTEKIVPNAAFQWYPTRRLSSDLDRIEAAGVALINITTEAVRMETIRARFFPEVAVGAPVDAPPFYDLRSIHDTLLGGRGGYHLSAGQVLAEMADFVAGEAARR
jgi:hypothetical protein